MGAGLGISQSSKYRVATDTTTWAFPENKIGIVNDVTSNYYLNHMKSDAVGLFLGLTGTSLNGAELYHYGLATHYVTGQNVARLVSEL
jgi:enoyl-CoA hydratase/carnithine racemase